MRKSLSLWNRKITYRGTTTYFLESNMVIKRSGIFSFIQCHTRYSKQFLRFNYFEIKNSYIKKYRCGKSYVEWLECHNQRKVKENKKNEERLRSN